MGWFLASVRQSRLRQVAGHCARNQRTWWRARIILALSALAVGLNAQTIWDGGGNNNNWSTASNWNNNRAPGNPTNSVLHFAGTTRLTPNVNSAWNVNGIVFDNNAGAFTIAGSTLTIATASGVLNNDNSTQTINNAITLGASQTWQTASTGGLTFGGSIALGSNTLTTNANSGTTITLGGVISGAGSLVKTGAGTLTLNGGNTYTGSTSIGAAGAADAGTITLGANNVLPGGVLNVYAGTLNYNTRSDTIGALNLGGGTSGSTATVSGTTGTLTLGGNVTYSAVNNANGATITGRLALGSTNRTFTIGDSTAAANDLAVNAAISGTGGIVKAGAGNLALSGANTYTGATTLSAGTLSVSTLANGGAASGIGQSSNAAANLVLNGGTLRYTGAGSTTNRLFTLGASGGTLDSSGSGALTFSNTGALAASGTGNRTLTLTGANTGYNLLYSTIANPTSGATSVTKTGSGIWILAGNNSYTGVTTATEGILAAAYNANALGTGAASLLLNGGSVYLANDSALAFGRNTTVATSSSIFSERTSAGVGVTHSLGTLSIGANTLNVGSGAYFTTSGLAGITFGATSLTGNATFNVTNGASSTTVLTLGALNDGGSPRTLTKSGNGSLVLGTAASSLVEGTAINITGGTLASNHATALGSRANLTLSSGATFSLGASQTLGALNGTGGTAALGANTLTIGNPASNLSSSFGGVISGTGGIIKAGTGTLTLSGANTYTGATTINGGILHLAATNALASAANVTVNATTAGGTATFSLANNVSQTVGALTLGGTGATGTSTNSTTLGTGATLTLGGNVTSSATNNPLGSTISGGTLNLGSADRTFAVGDSANAAADLTVSSTVSGTGGLIKTGAGTLLLSGASTYTGSTTINAGIVSISADNNLGAAPGSATANKLVFGGGSLLGTSTFTLNSNRGTTLSTGTTSNLSAATGQTLTYGGIIAGAGNLTIGTPSTGAGTVVLSGNNSSYSGSTHIQAGTLSVGTIRNLGGGNSALGNPTTIANGTIRIGSGTSGATLRYAGTGATTNRVIDLAGTTGGAALDSSGTGALVFTSDFTATGAGSKSLTLTGSGTAANLISGRIVDNSSTNKTSLIKSGGGTWRLSGANTFTGGVTVNSGTLIASGATNLGGFTVLGNYAGIATPTTVITVNSGGTLALQSTDTTSLGTENPSPNLTMSLSGSGMNGAGALHNLAGNSTWTGNITLAGHTTIQSSATDGGVLWLGAYMWAPPTSIELNNHALTFTGAGHTLISSTVGKSSGDTGSVALNLAAPDASVTFSGLRNYYTGATTVNQGILQLAIYDGMNPNAAVLGDLTIGDGSGGSATAVVTPYYSEQIADNASVTINADGLLDLASFQRNETLANLTLRGGRISTGLGNLILTGNVAVSTPATSTIDGTVTFDNGTRTFTVDAGSTLLMNANLFFGGYEKAGAGTMIVTSDNVAGYRGTTTVSGGVLAVRHGGALGDTGGNNPGWGTYVQSGATLQLENITVQNEYLKLTGGGFGGLGALNATSGTNTWTGEIELGGDTTIRNTAGLLTLSGPISGTGTTPVSPQTLTFAGNGNVNVTTIRNGDLGGAVAVVKQGTGTLTLTSQSDFRGALAIDGGTFAVTGHDLLQARNNHVAIAAGATFALSGGSALSPFSNTIARLTGAGAVSLAANTGLRVNATGASTFDGRLTGPGLFEKAGSGTLTFSSAANTSAFNFAGTIDLLDGTLEFQGGTLANRLSIGTLQLSGGTLLLSASTINVGTLHITGDTILDFGTGAASILNANNITIASGATLTVRNWSSEVDFLFAHSSFRLNDSSGQLAGFNTTGVAPQNQIHFEGDPFSPDGSKTAWTNYGFLGYTDYQIRPIPEPSTYGAILLGTCAALFCWIRRRRVAR